MKSKPRRKQEKPITHDQWIEIKSENGITVSTFYPSNEDFEKERIDWGREPTLIYRRLNFIHGVPKEYLWTNPTEPVSLRGGLFLVRMSVKDWLSVMEKERRMNPRHVTAAANPLPRPEAFGPCPCEKCTQDRERL